MKTSKTQNGRAKPRFKHDCESCVFLGHIYYPAPHYKPDENGEYKDLYTVFKHADLYYCAQSDSSMGGTVLARFSSEGSDYASTPIKLLLQVHQESAHAGMSTAGPAIIAAYWFARGKGLVK